MGLVPAVIAFLAWLEGRRAKGKVEETTELVRVIHVQINSRWDELAKLLKQSGYAEGVRDERERESSEREKRGQSFSP